jgi:hypothetical protein
VLALVRAEGRRQDDLREMNDRHLRDMITVRAEDSERLINVRAEYEEKLRLAESKRIDAIRAVDVSALNRASEVALQQASALAAQVTTVADTFRTALTTELALIRKDIAELRESQSATGGRSAGLSQGWSFLIGAMGLVLTVLLIVSIVIGTR